MRYTANESGVLNNFAVEPKIYEAEAPSNAQMVRYAIQGALAAALVGGVLWIAFAVS